VRRSRLLLAAFLLCLPQVFAEEIQLKDGTKIAGTVTGFHKDAFQIKTAYGSINVPRANVVSITFPENQPAAAAGPAPIAESLSGTNYINRTAGFQLSTPAGWQIAPELRKNKDNVAALKSADSTLYMIVTSESFAGNLATFKILAETEYKSRFVEYQKISESEAQVDGRPGVRLVFHGQLDKATMLTWSVYIVPYEGRMVRVTFCTLEPLFNDALPVFEKMAASYHSLSSNLSPNLAQR
jgi:hypothetical protein